MLECVPACIGLKAQKHPVQVSSPSKDNYTYADKWSDRGRFGNFWRGNRGDRLGHKKRATFGLKFLGDNKLYIINNYNSLWINYSNTWTLNLLKWNTSKSTIPNSLQSRTGSETMRTVIPTDWKQQAVSFCVSLWSFCAILWLFCVSLYSFCGHFASFCGCYFPASAPINSYGHFRGKNIQNALKK